MEPTIRIQSRLGKRQPGKRAGAVAGREGIADATPEPMFPDTLARRLALAHYIERLIEDGKLRNYAQAAAMLGVTRARMSQLMDLALLSAEVQERVLLGLSRFCERDVRGCLNDPSESASPGQ